MLVTKDFHFHKYIKPFWGERLGVGKSIKIRWGKN